MTYYDESAAIRTINLSIPSTFQNQSNVQMRFIVDTDLYNNYGGGFPGDAQEGLTVSEIRVYIDDDNIAHSDDFYTTTTASNYVANPPTGASTTNQWGHHIFTTGGQYQSLSFEDSGANAPTVSDASGWSRNPSSSSTAIGNKWALGQLGPNAGPSTQEPSFPYVYGTNLNGDYGNQADAYLISPSYSDLQQVGLH